MIQGDMKRPKNDSCFVGVVTALCFPCLSHSNEDWGVSGELRVMVRVCFLAKAQAICSAVFASQKLQLELVIKGPVEGGDNYKCMSWPSLSVGMLSIYFLSSVAYENIIEMW